MIERVEFEERWEKEIIPLLDNPSVTYAVKQFKHDYEKRRAPIFKDDPFQPWQCGREPDNGWNTLPEYSLASYTAMDCCHGIQKICCAIGRLLYPGLSWTHIGDSIHSVAVGCIRRNKTDFLQSYKDGQIVITADLNLTFYGNCSSQTSLAFALYPQYCMDITKTLRPGSRYNPKQTMELGEEFRRSEKILTGRVWDALESGAMRIVPVFIS
jgi:hypothetical protein